jgi:hypothetical protein
MFLLQLAQKSIKSDICPALGLPGFNRFLTIFSPGSNKDAVFTSRMSGIVMRPNSPQPEEGEPQISKRQPVPLSVAGFLSWLIFQPERVSASPNSEALLVR